MAGRLNRPSEGVQKGFDVKSIAQIAGSVVNAIDRAITGSTAEERAARFVAALDARIERRLGYSLDRLATAIEADGVSYDRAYDAAYEAALARGLPYADAHDEAARLADAAVEADLDDAIERERALYDPDMPPWDGDPDDDPDDEPLDDFDYTADGSETAGDA